MLTLMMELQFSEIMLAFSFALITVFFQSSTLIVSFILRIIYFVVIQINKWVLSGMFCS